ncbi:MAG: hypothetical protein HFH36_07660 [Lachnospiraceae bacterium]|nr:hypothetical protein [Lachnospiraceae bacterium]
MDNINLEIGQVYADIADGQRRADENQQDNHDPFDKLEDLAKKKMKKESKKGRTSQQENGAGQAGATQGQDGNAPDDGPQGTKKNVDNLRGSSLYMAVVLARELEKGGKNPMADNKFIRYFKSSKFDSVADKVKLAGAVSSTLGSFDKQYGRSAISQGVGIVSNMVTIVSSVKAFSQKLKKYRASGSKLDKAFGAIGMLTDFTMILSKAIGIAQNILALMKVHQSKIFQSVVKYVKMILGGITQIGLVMTGTKGLVDAKKKLGMMSAMENKRWAVIEQSVLPRYNEQENDGQGEEEEIHEGEAPAPNPAQPPVQTEAQAEGQGGGRLSLKQKREQAKQRRATRKGRRNLANMLLKREDVADEDKDKLALYLASCRMYGKIKSGIIMGASGLVVSAIGLSTSIASGTALSGDLNAAKAAKNLGMMGAIGGIGVAGLKVGMGHNDRKAQNNEETQVIKGRLWGLIHGLDDEKYGLKGISEGLEANPSPEKAAEAKGVVDKYNAVDGQMKGAFVNYDRLLKAANAEDFRNMLVADL